MHHALTNFIGHDEDLSGGPLLYLWPPSPARDKPWRPAQALYVGVLFSLLHVIWRVRPAPLLWHRRRPPRSLSLSPRNPFSNPPTTSPHPQNLSPSYP